MEKIDISAATALFKIKLSEHSGLVRNVEEAENLLRQYELATTTNFCCNKVKKGFGSTDLTRDSHKVWWEDEQLPFDHEPFIQVNHRVYDCRHGVDRHLSQKKKNKTSNPSDHSFKKHRNMVQGTRKLNCPAQIHMREYIKFPEFKIAQKTEWRQKTMSKRLRECIKKGGSGERWIHIQLPNLSEHNTHPIGSAGGLHQGIDKMLVTKIQELVVAGARSVKEVRRHLKIYVEQDLYKGTKAPPKSNQRFYPSKTTIRSHIYKAVIKERFSKFDQENLQKKIECWKLKCPDEMFFFRPLVKYSEESSSVHDNKEQSNDDDDEDDDDDVDD
ncbi:Hypothetical predicted protein, partial [Paramuricea clavata]